MATTSGAFWVRAGMDGQIVGFDINAALARPSAQHADAEVLELLLQAIEVGALSAFAAIAKRKAKS